MSAAPLDGLRVVDLSNTLPGTQASQLFADFGNYLRAKLPILALTLVLLWLGRRTLRPRRRTGRVATVLGPLLLVASFFVPTQYRHVQAATPDPTSAAGSVLCPCATAGMGDRWMTPTTTSKYASRFTAEALLFLSDARPQRDETNSETGSVRSNGHHPIDS